MTRVESVTTLASIVEHNKLSITLPQSYISPHATFQTPQLHTNFETMSAYLNLPVQINTMVCRTCGTESFAWLAEVFMCPICGDHDYVFPTFATDFDRGSAAKAGEGEGEPERDGSVEDRVELGNLGRKRKRPTSDDEPN
jgi:hypothetical protein